MAGVREPPENQFTLRSELRSFDHPKEDALKTALAATSRLHAAPRPRPGWAHKKEAEPQRFGFNLLTFHVGPPGRTDPGFDVSVSGRGRRRSTPAQVAKEPDAAEASQHHRPGRRFGNRGSRHTPDSEEPAAGVAGRVAGVVIEDQNFDAGAGDVYGAALAIRKAPGGDQVACRSVRVVEAVPATGELEP
jgi:hypothetical protein